MHMTVRFSKDTSAEEQQRFLNGLNRAFDRYAAGGQKAQCLIELFLTEKPYTEANEARGFIDIETANNPWWEGAIAAVMEEIRKRSDGRGVKLYTRSAKTYDLAPLAQAA